MFKKLTIFAALLMFACSVGATESTALKIGVINVADILKASPEMSAMNEKLRTQFEPRQQKIMALQQSLNDDQAKLKRDGTIMSETERATLQEKMAVGQRDLRRQQEDFMQDARAEEKRVMDVMLDKINHAVQEIADKEHYDVILQRSMVAFSSDRADLTQQVIVKLKQQKKQG
jgi:outer membrane protein